WSIGLDFQLTIFDKGERKLASDNMKSNLANLTYEESLKQIEETIMGLETKRKTLNFDVSINQIDLKNAQEDYEKNIDLYKKGFITQDDLSLSEIALQMNKLNLENTENSLKVNELRLMQQYYVNLWGDNN
ncbi:MAG: TolC family protein, partial [Defluviitoga tunisiensis]